MHHAGIRNASVHEPAPWTVTATRPSHGYSVATSTVRPPASITASP